MFLYRSLYEVRRRSFVRRSSTAYLRRTFVRSSLYLGPRRSFVRRSSTTYLRRTFVRSSLYLSLRRVFIRKTVRLSFVEIVFRKCESKNYLYVLFVIENPGSVKGIANFERG